MVDLISKALEIAEEYPVFPCDVKKRPVCEGGFKAATQDPDEIEKIVQRAKCRADWYANRPDKRCVGD